MVRVKIMREKKNKKIKGSFPYESSLGGIRLTTSPLLRSRQAPSNKLLDRVGKAHRFSKYCFTRLKCIETVNLFWLI